MTGFYPDYPDYLGEITAAISPQGVFSQSFLNFRAIKMGDINGSNNPDNFSGDAEDRFRKTEITINRASFDKNEEISVTFHIEDIADIVAYQMGIGFDPNALEFIEDLRGTLPDLPYEMELFGTKHVDKGELRASWFHPKAINNDLHGEQKLFTLKFRALKPIEDISSVLQINDNILDNIFYDNEGNELNIDLTATTTSSHHDMKLTTNLVFNTPNPFKQATTFFIELPESENTLIELFDLNGKKLKEYNPLLKGGSNYFTIEQTTDLPKGILIYKISNSQISYSGKMLKQ